MLMKEINLIQNVCVESSLEMKQAPRLASNCLLDGRPHQYSILHDHLYDIVGILTPSLTLHTETHFPHLLSPSQHSQFRKNGMVAAILVSPCIGMKASWI